MISNKMDFSKIPTIIDIPNLLGVQKKSFTDFLQIDVLPEKRMCFGLQSVFQDIFPITNMKETLSLEFVSYSLSVPVYDMDECREKGLTYAAPLRAKVRLFIKNEEDENIREAQEQEIFICEIPLMTESGSFIINGAERVIVSQLHRSPGVFFEEDDEKKISSYGKKLYFSRIIPYRGAWVEFEFDINNAIYVKINKKRKMLASVILRALGYQKDSEILKLFCDVKEIKIKEDPKKMKSLLVDSIAVDDIVDSATGEVIVESNQKITSQLLKNIMTSKVSSVSIISSEDLLSSIAIRNTLAKDSIRSQQDAINEIFKRLRPFDFTNFTLAKKYLDELLFSNSRKYDLGKVGRYKLNKKLNINIPLNKRTLSHQDVIATIKYMIDLNNGTSGNIDDIDHLGNRRIKLVGELLENQFRVGLSHMERLAREKMNIIDKDKQIIHEIINASPVVAILRKFYGSSQLSQFMDQTNPLAELTHKRRLSALGPGGLNRKRAGFEVRDVHYTHYGRICPIETPEGPNIGLITSLSTFARVNEFGFIESPYRKVRNGIATHDIEYLTADDEDNQIIAQANAPIDGSGRFKENLVLARRKGDFPLVLPEEVNYMDISPKQLVSVSAAAIPFLEHDDANRALMGSNMQRQAVPLLFTDKPVVATGIEGKIARDSQATVTARRGGIVKFVDSSKIIIWANKPSAKRKFSSDDIDVYKLRKFVHSNQDTCINQKPSVKIGEKIACGQVIADGPGTSEGELALGRNVLVAFMPWEGYNFEDAILLSEKLVKEDMFTSVHIQEFEIEARDLKLRAEEITRDIPNVGEEALKNLDESGVIRIGAEVRPGDIIVGKVTPKGETQLTPEERLLRVIFGDKAEDVQDASLYVPPGVEGKIIDIKVFSRKEKGQRKSTENKKIEKMQNENQAFIAKIKQEAKKNIEILQKEFKDKVQSSRENSEITKRLKEQLQDNINAVNMIASLKIDDLKINLQKRVEKIRKGDELPVGVNKLVKVYIMNKCKISVGDKISGRHGNKGVVSRILPEEDMPYLADGTPVEIVLNPLSVPSRMNIGQLMELQLGWAAVTLGIQMVTPVFDGASEMEIKMAVSKANLPEDGKIELFDGRTGQMFAEKVTMGYMYIMKLAHLVEDKIHARSIGPYSLITRQPLGGKAQFGGQRFGEMEVWAIEGYGAAYTLQEFLTVKSDDVTGRIKMYEAIIKGEEPPLPGIPESFKVLVRELQSLGLNVELLKKDVS